MSKCSEIMTLVDDLCAYLPIEKKEYKDICDIHAELQVLADLYPDPSPEWISTKNMMPEFMEKVLVVVDRNGKLESPDCIFYHNSKGKYWANCCNDDYFNEPVLFWMPLPKLPTQQSPRKE